MLLTENAVAAEILVNAAWAANEALKERLDGVHVSDIVGCSRKAWLKRNGRTQTYSTQDKLLFLTGSGHHAILQAIAEVPTAGIEAEVETPVRIISPGVLIHGTIDMLLMEPDFSRVIPIPDEIPGEIKSTRSSAGKPIESSSHYIEQEACYCVATGSPRARLYVLHMMGNYRDQRTPMLNAWDIEFTPEELEAWEKEMIRRYWLIVGDTIPSHYEAYKWECQYCPFGPKGSGECPGGGLRQPFFINRSMPESIPLVES